MVRIIQTVVILLFLVGPALAQSPDVQLLKQLTLPAPVVQMAATVDGQRFYLLLDNGEVQLYQQNGQMISNFVVGKDVTAIASLGANRLLLTRKNKQEVVVVAIFPRAQIALEGAAVTGPETAPVTVVIYDDFECPYCARETASLRTLLEKYPEQIKLVFKNFPLAMHSHAQIAALAGLAAQKQGKFWPLHDLLFANYQHLSRAKIFELAGSLELDMERFTQDLKDESLKAKIDADIREGKRIGVRGTPTLFINGRRVQQRSIEAMSRMIDEELAQEKRDKL